MTTETFFQKRTLHMLAILMLLLLFPFLIIIPWTTVHAATDQTSGINNPAYTFTTTNGATVSTKANANETTVLIFGHTNCSYTRATLNSISSCDWVKRSDIRVIFAETNGHTKAEVQSYEQGYQCPDMIFCYDEGMDIFLAMAQYGQLYGINGGQFPTIILIDQNNKVQNLLTGQKTADELLNEIKKFADISEGGNSQPPTGTDSGIENFAYGLNTIDNTIVSTKANPNETTVLLFGYTTCNFTKATLQDIHKSSWVGQSNIRVIFADVYGASLSETKEFAQNYPDKGIIFCHDEKALNFNFALSYLSLYNYTGGTFPYIVLIDKNNKIQSITLGAKTADEIITDIEKFTKEEPVTPERPVTEPSAPSISNVSGLKASSAAKSVKLTWKKISTANGYIIYQYNNSSKKWVEKTRTTAASYTIKGLSPGTSYRFAVKAFIQPQNGKQVISESYTFLDTSTNPEAVNFKVTAKKKKAVIKWNKVKGATGYIVYYKTKANNPWKKLKSTKNTSYTKNSLKSGTTYIFTVKAYKTYKGITYTSSFTSKKAKIK